MCVCVCECACLKGGCKCAFSSCKRLDQLQSIQQTFNNNNSNNNNCAQHYAINIRAGVKMCKMFGVNSSEMTCETLRNYMKQILQQLKFNTFNGFTLKTSRKTIWENLNDLKGLCSWACKLELINFEWNLISFQSALVYCIRFYQWKILFIEILPSSFH